VRAEVQRYGIDGVAISTDCLTGASETGPNALSSLGVDAHRTKDSSIVFHYKISLLLVTNNGTAILKMNQARQRLLFGSREAEIGFLCVIAFTHSVQNGAHFNPLGYGGLPTNQDIGLSGAASSRRRRRWSFASNDLPMTSLLVSIQSRMRSK
jgi:hypothetical protein